MLARVTNFGYRSKFPTHLGDLFIPRGDTVELRDKKALTELKDWPDLTIDVIEDEPLVDYSKYPINQLRRLAAKQGIKNAFFLKKAEIVTKLTERAKD